MLLSITRKARAKEIKKSSGDFEKLTWSDMGKLSIQSEAVQELIRRELKVSADVFQIQGGEESQAYLVVEQEAKRIVRVSSSCLGFEKDAFAHRHFHSSSLPIPAVFQIGQLDESHCFCISNYVEGTTLQDLSRDEVRQTVQATGAILHSLHASDISMTRGFGVLDQHGIGSHQSWADFLRWPAHQRWPGSFLDGEILSAARARLLGMAEDIRDFRCLIHGDFGSNNVLSDKGSITAVIDWSEAAVGDPLYDMANIFFWRTWLMCMEEQSRFLEETEDLDASAQDRLLCYQLHIGLREATECASSGNLRARTWAMNRLVTLLR